MPSCRNLKCGLLAGLTLILLGGGLSAQTFTFSGENMSSVIAKGQEKTVLKGNAQITSDTTLITAQEIELYGKESRFAISRGGVVVTDKVKGIVLKAQELFFDRDKKISRVNGAAVLEDQKNEMIVKGGFFENRDKDDIIIIQIGVRILKKDLSCRSEYAKFNRKKDLLELSGLPVVTWKGDEYRANRIIVNIKTNEIELDGKVSGKVSAESDKTKAATPNAPAESTSDTQKPDPTKTPEAGTAAPPVNSPTTTVPGGPTLPLPTTAPPTPAQEIKTNG